MTPPRLATFLDAARSRVARGFYAPAGAALRPNGSFVQALAKGGAIVAEAKPASPSEGRLLRGPPDRLLAAYAGGADAVSALADADFFDGSPSLVRQAHATGLPVLFKDFVVDEAQLECARHCGASAVLLIDRALDPVRREALVEAAHRLGLEALLEVFDARDWATAKASRADLVGVNARDLDTLEVDAAGALILLGQVAHEQPHRPALALSGIHDRTGARLAWAAGARGVLVGTALLRSPDPALLLRSLRRPLAKVCGLRTPADVDAAVLAGADLVGLVVGSPGSPREVAPVEAQRLADAARAKGLRPVLVTRSADLSAVREWCRLVRPDYVQLHGTAPPEWVHSLAAIPVHVLFAGGPGGALHLHGAGLVLDGADAGGTGRTHDWDAARDALASETRLSLVAGGLGADNAAEAIQRSGAWGADASSGLESAPGRKDPAKVAAFVAAVHSA
jgi:indole-3-glycerol phosphate synthase/phosphoribosylanthranilate isomerase